MPYGILHAYQYPRVVEKDYCTIVVVYLIHNYGGYGRPNYTLRDTQFDFMVHAIVE